MVQKLSYMNYVTVKQNLDLGVNGFKNYPRFGTPRYIIK